MEIFWPKEMKKRRSCLPLKGSEVKFSFRSKAGQEPSSLDLARILGGSGHVLAAGARVSLKDFLEMIVI